MMYADGKRAAVSFTFDDARVSQVDVGLPILDRHGVRASFYVLPAKVEERLDGWRHAVAQGHEIGNHTVCHPCSGNFSWARGRALEDFTLERIGQDMESADAAIGRLLGVKPTTFAYPCGQTFVGRGKDQQSYIPLVRERFLAGRSYHGETHNHPDYCNLACLTCIGFDGRDLDTALGWIERAVDDGGWVILCGHEVGGEAFQTVRADVLDALCGHIAGRADVWVDTVAAVADCVRRQVAEA